MIDTDMNKNWRQEQLQEWERSRLSELRLDLFAHYWRSIAGLLVTSWAWWAVDRFELWHAGMLKYAIAFCGGMYLTGRVIVWLRLWGSYIERRLIEIEALIGNERPSYFDSGDIISFDDNPLYARLTEIEDQIVRLRNGESGQEPLE